MNAKVGDDSTRRKDAMGRHGCGTMNDNKERPVKFCHNCDNWLGITLLSIFSKVFCRVLLKRIDCAIDVKLRQEQAGFQKGQNIIEKCKKKEVH